MQATSVKIVETQTVTANEAEAELSAMLKNENIQKQVADQLKRLQRDFQGLPPLAAENI